MAAGSVRHQGDWQACSTAPKHACMQRSRTLKRAATSASCVLRKHSMSASAAAGPVTAVLTPGPSSTVWARGVQQRAPGNSSTPAA